MSMPSIQLACIERNEAINNIIASIAMEEAALSHILNAEGEKIQAALNVSGVTLSELIELNKTVVEVVDNVGNIEEWLYSKLCLVLNQHSPKAPFQVLKYGINDQTVPSKNNLIIRLCSNEGHNLSGGLYRLQGESFMFTLNKSSEEGLLDFGEIPRNNSYTMLEIIPPPGFQPSKASYAISADAQGNITVDGNPPPFEITCHPATQVHFTVRKAKPSGAPINGGEFLLTGTNFSRNTAATEGVLDFGQIHVSDTYELVEKKAQHGYFPDKSTYRVTVTPYGLITVDGKPGQFTIVNTPLSET
jgi:hypothetical protein